MPEPAIRRPWRTPRPGRRRRVRAQPDGDGEDGEGEDRDRDQVAGRDGGERPEKVGEQIRVAARIGQADEDHTPGDASVEQQRKRDIAACGTASPHHLDGDGAKRGDDNRGPHGRGVQQKPQRDAEQGDVPDTVAHQRHPALDEVGPDRRRGQPDKDRRDHGPLHECGLKELRQRRTGLMEDRGEAPGSQRSHPGSSAGACGCRWSWAGSA